MSQLPVEDLSPQPPEPRALNRELSWMAFNERVLEEALDPSNPLLERLRFLTIFQTNLDEFFMVRVSGLKQQVLAGVEAVSEGKLSPRAQLARIAHRLRPVLVQAQQCLHDDLLPQLAEHGVRLVHYTHLDARQRSRWDDHYLQHVHPVLTPLAVGPTHPFPFISNLSMNIAVMVTSPSGEERLARVKIPGALPQLVSLDGLGGAYLEFMPLEELIAGNVDKLFPGMQLGVPWVFRVTRDADVEIKDDEANDLMRALEAELRKRRFGQAVRLEVQSGAPVRVRNLLRTGLGLRAGDMYEVEGLLGIERLSELVRVDRPQLKFPPFTPSTPKSLQNEDLFAVIRGGDVLLHHPYQSFGPVIEFLEHAAVDPAVLAIKQTLYRTSGDSPVIRALERAIENGKQVAAIVELKARFDEENNIVWAKRLEEAGVHVMYGASGIKVHCKLALVVRQEAGHLRRYAHVGTGNYNSTTARIYTDLSLLTCNPAITEDVAEVFNQLTGFARPSRYQNLLVAPRHMLQPILERIAVEAANARDGGEGRIVAKLNSLTDEEVIEALYTASEAGVQIDLLVRGICRLRPGVPGMSDRIRVRSVVGRFLEHSRVYWFHNGGDPRVYIGSADWMERNLRRRVEVLSPVLDPAHKLWLREVMLERYLDDMARTRLMNADGSYRRLSPTDGPDVQTMFMADAVAEDERARAPRNTGPVQ